MSGFKIVNLKELDDAAAARGAEGIELRFGRTALESEHLGVSYVRYAASHRSGIAHHHESQEEAYVVIGGSGRVLLDGEVHELKQWDVLRCSPAVVRSFEAGPDGLEVIAVGSDRPEGGDGKMVDPTWPE